MHSADQASPCWAPCSCDCCCCPHPLGPAAQALQGRGCWGPLDVQPRAQGEPRPGRPTLLGGPGLEAARAAQGGLMQPHGRQPYGSVVGNRGNTWRRQPGCGFALAHAPDTKADATEVSRDPRKAWRRPSPSPMNNTARVTSQRKCRHGRLLASTGAPQKVDLKQDSSLPPESLYPVKHWLHFL